MGQESVIIKFATGRKLSMSVDDGEENTEAMGPCQWNWVHYLLGKPAQVSTSYNGRTIHVCFECANVVPAERGPKGRPIEDREGA